MNICSHAASRRKISSIILLTSEKREKKGAAKFPCLTKSSRALRDWNQDFPCHFPTVKDRQTDGAAPFSGPEAAETCRGAAPGWHRQPPWDGEPHGSRARSPAAPHGHRPVGRGKGMGPGGSGGHAGAAAEPRIGAFSQLCSSL